MPLTELRPEDPEQVGPYRLLNRLGSGGMGRVYLGQSPGRRLVALKVIHPQLATDPKFRLRFAREVAAARQVSGVFTAPVVGADVDSAVPWLATAFVKGPSLGEAVTEGGPLPYERALDVAAGLAEGVAAIHAAGVVHRDLKPANVILAEDGPRIIDFGVSRTLGDATLTRAGEVFGSLRFMSPEQAMGAEVTAASDIFSLGALLVFAAAGHGPFSGGLESAIMYRIIYEEPDLGQVPAPLCPLIRQCLAKEPGARPSAHQVLAEIAGRHASASQPAIPGAGAATWRPAGDGQPGPHWAAPSAAPGPAWMSAGGSGPAETGSDAVGTVGYAAAAGGGGTAVYGTAEPAATTTRPRWRTGLIAGAAAVAALGAAVTALLAWSAGRTAPSAPTALARASVAYNGVSLRWSAPAAGPAPDHYVVSQDGRVIASVPASDTGYRVTGLSPHSSYEYQVAAESGGRLSGPSAPVRVSTGFPPVSAAGLTGGWQGGYNIVKLTGYFSTWLTASSPIDGAWRFIPGCAVGPCPATLDGRVGNTAFNVKLTPQGNGYIGSAVVNYAGCGLDDRMNFMIFPRSAAMAGRAWVAASWSGVMTMTAAPGTCDSGTVTTTLSSASPTTRFGAAAPVIRSVSPGSPRPRQRITIRGTGFGALQGNSSIVLADAGTGWGLPGNTATLQIDSWSADSVTFTLPASSGSWPVTPGTKGTLAVTTASGGISNYVTLAISTA